MALEGPHGHLGTIGGCSAVHGPPGPHQGHFSCRVVAVGCENRHFRGRASSEKPPPDGTRGPCGHRGTIGRWPTVHAHLGTTEGTSRTAGWRPERSFRLIRPKLFASDCTDAQEQPFQYLSWEK